ncbi:PREDICTED: TBC1 domain family member 21, partial [Fulmarus glacialis]|uniref:TBC1 domain family member 21 n=1 Tax=Fulmarus glacialis TaxID=30455 RepID=UPI00051B8DD2
MVDKKQLEKILLLNYVCNAEAEYQQGFCEMLLLFHLLVEREHEIYCLPPENHEFLGASSLDQTVQEHSCVMNIGVQKSFIMLKTSAAFMDPTFAKHLEGKGLQVIHSLVPCFCFTFQGVFKSFNDVWRLWEVFLMQKPCRNSQVLVALVVREQVLRENRSRNDILT